MTEIQVKNLTAMCTWPGHEAPGMILLGNLKGALRLDRSKDTSLHVSTCTSYDFIILTPAVWKLWL